MQHWPISTSELHSRCGSRKVSERIIVVSQKTISSITVCAFFVLLVGLQTNYLYPTIYLIRLYTDTSVLRHGTMLCERKAICE